MIKTRATVSPMCINIISCRQHTFSKYDMHCKIENDMYAHVYRRLF